VGRTSPDEPAATVGGRKRVLVVLDLGGFSRHARAHDDATIAKFLNTFYALCIDHIQTHQGQVIKFMGDGCLAVFEPDDAATAVSCVQQLRSAAAALARNHEMRTGAGANIHLAQVIEAHFGPAHYQPHDVLCRGVNHVFMMGRGDGLRISEPVYRALPSKRRSVWMKNKPAVTYTLDDHKIPDGS